MGMWPAIQGLLTSSTSTDGIRSAALWIVGTAAQNNPSAQNAVSTKSLKTVSDNIDNILTCGEFVILLSHRVPGTGL